MDLWELDLVELISLQKYNDKYRYLLQVIDVVSKYLYSVPLHPKTGRQSRQHSNQSYKTLNIRKHYVGDLYMCLQIRENIF